MGATQAVLFVLAVLLIWELRSVVMLFFASVVGAVAMDMPVSAIGRAVPCLPRAYAVLLVLVAMLVVVFLMNIFLLPEVFFQCKELAALGPKVFYAIWQFGLIYLEALEALLAQHFQMERFSYLRLRLEDPEVYAALIRHLRPMGMRILQSIGTHLYSLGRCLIMLVLATQFCLRPAEHRAIVVNSTPAFYRHRASEILDRCRDALGNLLLGLTISASGVGMLTWLGLTFLGCPLALFSGLLCGALQFIPTVGPPLGILTPTCVALVVSGRLAVHVVLWGFFVQYLVKPILRPQVMRWYITILPTTALLAQAGFGLLLGFPGALLALPFVAVSQVVLHEAFQKDIMDRWVVCERPARLHERRNGLRARRKARAARVVLGRGL